MKLNTLPVAACVAATLLLAGCGNDTPAPSSDTKTAAPKEDTSVKWRLASTFSSRLPLLGTRGKAFTSELSLLTGGAIDMHFYEPGALSPPLEIFDAVSYGAIEAGWSTSGYWAGKVPALQLFSSVPFGPSATEYLAWYDYGGGRALFEDIYAKHNIKGIICGMTPPEAAGWFKEDINSIEDFKGRRIRFFGLGGKVLEKIGASPQLIAGGEIYQALELGVIDGSEFSMPSVDINFGFYDVAKYYFLPGWHQQSTLFELIVNMDAWRKLSKRQQFLIETACAANVRYGISEGDATQGEALEKIAAEGVTIKRLPKPVLQALKQAWEEVAQEQAAADPDFARVWASLSAFRATYKKWSDLGYLKD